MGLDIARHHQDTRRLSGTKPSHPEAHANDQNKQDNNGRKKPYMRVQKRQKALQPRKGGAPQTSHNDHSY